MKRKILRVYGDGIYNIKSFKDDRHNFIFKIDNQEECIFPKKLFSLNIYQNYYDIKRI